MQKYLLTAILLLLSVFAGGAAYGAEPEPAKELDFEEAYASIFIGFRGDMDEETIALNYIRALKWFMANKDKDPRCTDDVLADVAIWIREGNIPDHDSEGEESIKEMSDLANKLLFSIHSFRVNVYLVHFMYGFDLAGIPAFYDFSCHDELVRRIKNALPQDIEDFKTMIIQYPDWLFVKGYLREYAEYNQYNSIYLLWLFYKYNRKEYFKMKRLFEKYCILFERYIYHGDGWDMSDDRSYHILWFPENKEQVEKDRKKYDEMDGKEGWEMHTSIAETKKWFKSFKVIRLDYRKKNMLRKMFIKYVRDAINKKGLVGSNALHKITNILNGILSEQNDYDEELPEEKYTEQSGSDEELLLEKYTDIILEVMIESLKSDVEKKYAVLALIHKLCSRVPSVEQFNMRKLITNVIDVLADELTKCEDEKVSEDLFVALFEIYNVIFSCRDYDVNVEMKIKTDVMNALKHKFMRVRYLAAVVIDAKENEAICNLDLIKWRSSNSFYQSNLIHPSSELFENKESGNIMAQLRDMLKMDDAKWNYFAMRLLGMAVRYRSYETIGLRKFDVPFSDETWALIVRHLHNEDRGVRYWAVAAVAESGRRQLAGELISILNDKDSHIKGMALGGLQSLSGKKFGYDRVKWQKWWDANKGEIDKGTKDKQARDAYQAIYEYSVSMRKDLPKDAVIKLIELKRFDLIEKIILSDETDSNIIIMIFEEIPQNKSNEYILLVPVVLEFIRQWQNKNIGHNDDIRVRESAYSALGRLTDPPTPPTTVTMQNLLIKKRLELTVIPDSVEILPYEPLYVSIKVHNISSKESRGCMLATMRAYKSYMGAPFVHCADSKYRGLHIGASYMEPGEKIISDEIIFIFDGKPDFAFDRPGEYKLKIRIGTLEKILNITVKQPNKREEDAAKLIINEEAARNLQGWDISESGTQILEELITKYPETAYADYARYEVATYYGESIYSDKVDEASCLKALKFLSEISDHNNRLKIKALRLMVDIMRQTPVPKEINSGEMLAWLDKNIEIAKDMESYQYVEKARKILSAAQKKKELESGKK